MNEQQTIKLLKFCIAIGIGLLLLGHYFLSYADLPGQMGISGMVISAGCIALGFVFSLPTKMYLTLLLVKKENKKDTKVKDVYKNNSAGKSYISY